MRSGRRYACAWCARRASSCDCASRPASLTARKAIDNIHAALDAGDHDALVRAQEAFRREAFKDS